MSVLLIYWPLSFYRVRLFFEQGRLLPYHWDIVHGPLWKVIVFQAYNKVPWSGWIGVYLAFTSFVFVGFTRNAQRAYEHCVELIYDRLLPKKLQAKLPRLRKISEACKEERNATLGTSSDTRSNVIMREGYLTPTVLSNSRKSGREPNKNWFDVDVEDDKSLHSSEVTVSGRDEEEGKVEISRVEEKSI